MTKVNKTTINSNIYLFLDIAQGNFSEETVVPTDLPAQREGSVPKDQDPLRPELPSKLTMMRNHIMVIRI